MKKVLFFVSAVFVIGTVIISCSKNPNTPTPTPAPVATPAGGGKGKITFVSDRDGNREIYAMEANGGNQTRLTNNAGLDYGYLQYWK